MLDPAYVKTCNSNCTNLSSPQRRFRVFRPVTKSHKVTLGTCLLTDSVIVRRFYSVPTLQLPDTKPVVMPYLNWKFSRNFKILFSKWYLSC